VVSQIGIAMVVVGVVVILASLLAFHVDSLLVIPTEPGADLRKIRQTAEILGFVFIVVGLAIYFLGLSKIN
jgi:hypothetical protein